MHRVHHKLQDTPPDPLNLNRGSFYLYFSKWFTKVPKDFEEEANKIWMKDVETDKLVMLQYRFCTKIDNSKPPLTVKEFQILPALRFHLYNDDSNTCSHYFIQRSTACSIFGQHVSMALYVDSIFDFKRLFAHVWLSTSR